MKNIIWVLIGAFGAAFILFVAAAAYILISSRSLSPGLALVSPSPTAAQTVLPTAPVSVPPTVTAVPTPIPPLVPVTGEVCGNSGTMTLLVLGESSPLDNPPRGTDAIRLVQVDFDRKIVKCLALPPDLWVLTPSMAEQNVSATTLTMAYYISKANATGTEKERMVAATNDIAQALVDNFAFTPDHYLVVQQDLFKDAVDQLGGVDLTLAADLNAAPEGFTQFKAGAQTFDGQAALDYVRIMSDGEWSRFDRQEQVLEAILSKALEPAAFLKVPGLVNVLYSDSVTDLSLNQISSLICLAQDSGVQVIHLTFDPGLVVTRSGQVLVPDTTRTSVFLEEQVGQ